MNRADSKPKTLSDVLDRILSERGHPSLAELQAREAAKTKKHIPATPVPPATAPPPPPSHHEREPGEDDAP